MVTTEYFSDTQKAFSKLPMRKLRKEVFLFKVMNSPRLSELGKKTINFLLNKRWYLINRGYLTESILKGTVFGHFCGGTSIANCRTTIDRLYENNVHTILDYSKESGDENTYDNAVNELLETIYEASKNRKVSFAVFKLTSIASMDLLESISNGTASPEEQENFESVKARVNRLCQSAFENKVRILIDAEHSWIQKAIDELAEEMMIRYNKNNFVVYNTVQMYRHDRLSYLKDLHLRLKSKGVKTALKIVRGAYIEIERERAEKKGYTSPIQLTKNDTDRDYDAALKYCLKNLNDIAICAGTHNPKSSGLIIELMRQFDVKENDTKVYFAQLLGMADQISNILGVNGFNVAKYVPYGEIKEVMPYLFRRVNENKSIEGEISRELTIRQSELMRRNQK